MNRQADRWFHLSDHTIWASTLCENPQSFRNLQTSSLLSALQPLLFPWKLKWRQTHRLSPLKFPQSSPLRCFSRHRAVFCMIDEIMPSFLTILSGDCVLWFLSIIFLGGREVINWVPGRYTCIVCKAAREGNVGPGPLPTAQMPLMGRQEATGGGLFHSGRSWGRPPCLL